MLDIDFLGLRGNIKHKRGEEAVCGKVDEELRGLLMVEYRVLVKRGNDRFEEKNSQAQGKVLDNHDCFNIMNGIS